MLPWNELLALNPAGWCSPIPTTMGPYTLDERLNESQTVQVYHAFHDGYARGVRLEVIDTDHTPQSRQAITRKAMRWLRIRHKHLFTPIDVGEHTGYVYLAFERIPGGTLAAGLSNARKRGLILPSSQILHIGKAIGDALKHLHSIRLVHGCLSPDAIVVSLKGAWMLADLEPGLLDLPLPFPNDKRSDYFPQDVHTPAKVDIHAYAVILSEMLLNLPPRIAARTVRDSLYSTTPGLHVIPEALFDMLKLALQPGMKSSLDSIEPLLDMLECCLCPPPRR